MDIQNVNIKLFALPGSTVHWPGLIPVFHRWIQNKSIPGSLIDVADYAHVPSGPGVLLIAHEAFYSVDNRANALGFLYNRRSRSEGSPVEKIAEAYSAVTRAAGLLEAEPELQGKLRFDPQHVELTVNDRLLAPNTDETFRSLTPDAARFFREQWSRPVQVKWNSSPRELFRVSISPEN